MPPKKITVVKGQGSDVPESGRPAGPLASTEPEEPAGPRNQPPLPPNDERSGAPPPSPHDENDDVASGGRMEVDDPVVTGSSSTAGNTRSSAPSVMSSAPSVPSSAPRPGPFNRMLNGIQHPMFLGYPTVARGHPAIPSRRQSGGGVPYAPVGCGPGIAFGGMGGVNPGITAGGEIGGGAVAGRGFAGFPGGMLGNDLMLGDIPSRKAALAAANLKKKKKELAAAYARHEEVKHRDNRHRMIIADFLLSVISLIERGLSEAQRRARLRAANQAQPQQPPNNGSIPAERDGEAPNPEEDDNPEEEEESEF